MPLTQLSDEDFISDGEIAPFLLEAALEVEPDKARLEQGVLADRADDFGSKADSYVAVLAVLAVALFLLGLSLTVTSRARKFLVVPGLVIGVVCVAWTLVISLGDTTDVSDQAIRITAEGSRLAAQGNGEAAITQFDRAIENSPEFAAAFARRSDAHFEAGSTQTSTGYISFVTNEARDRSIADGERALELGARDATLLSDLGFTLFLDSQFDRAAELTTEAVEGNDDLAVLWFNLGVIELARGNEGAAEDAYQEGMEILADEPDAFVRSEILSAARNDLVLLRDLSGADDDGADEVEGELAAFEAEQTPPGDDSEFAADVREADADEEIDDITIERSTNDPVFINAFFDRGDLDEDTPLALIWYYRATDDDRFEQLPGMKNFERAGSDDELPFSATFNECLPAGEYRVEVFSGTSRLGTGEGEVDAGPLGIVTELLQRDRRRLGVRARGLGADPAQRRAHRYRTGRPAVHLTRWHDHGRHHLVLDLGRGAGQPRPDDGGCPRDASWAPRWRSRPMRSWPPTARSSSRSRPWWGCRKRPVRSRWSAASLAPDPDGVLRVIIVIAPDRGAGRRGAGRDGRHPAVPPGSQGRHRRRLTGRGSGAARRLLALPRSSPG